jgi:hypothetical protein
MNAITKTSPKKGSSIVWRFRGNRGWRVAYVRSLKANGQIVELVDTKSMTMADELVYVRDIEWHAE